MKREEENWFGEITPKEFEQEIDTLDKWGYNFCYSPEMMLGAGVDSNGLGDEVYEAIKSIIKKINEGAEQ